MQVMQLKLSNKKLIISPQIANSKLRRFLLLLKNEGIDMLYIDPKKLTEQMEFVTVFPSKNANYVLLDKNITKITGKKIGRKIKVLSNSDIDRITYLVKSGLDFVIIEVTDWKIIPLENIIAKLHKTNTKIFVIAKSMEVLKMFSILEIGVDGVIFEASSIDDVKKILVNLNLRKLELKIVKIVEIKEIGDGERVCVDTVSILHNGEGMLIGNKSNFLFLIHNESIGSMFTTPRPFRVNAGAVHCYTLTPNETTKYLSEIETGHKVLITDHNGNVRSTTVGRAKIEKRPLIMIKASINNEIGSVIVQDAETIHFVKPRDGTTSVTELKNGDEVLAYVKSVTGRHFGMEIDEYILEK